MIKKTSSTNPNFHYFVSGRNPKLLIHTGTHGDEWEVINLVKETLEKYESRLPAFTFFPEISPSAVKARTRVNSMGKDINRVFFSNSPDPEVIENIKHLEDRHFDLTVTFHEDPEVFEYYIYDTNKSGKDNESVLKHNRKLKKFGIKLLDGIDDPDDPDLGYEFKNGYKKFVYKEGEPDNGMLTVWALNRGITDECLIPEIPGKLDIDQKRFVVESFFEEVLLIRS